MHIGGFEIGLQAYVDIHNMYQSHTRQVSILPGPVLQLGVFLCMEGIGIFMIHQPWDLPQRLFADMYNLYTTFLFFFSSFFSPSLYLPLPLFHVGIH